MRYTLGAFARTLTGGAWAGVVPSIPVVQGWKLAWVGQPAVPGGLRVADVRRDRVVEIPSSRFGAGVVASVVGTRTLLAVTLKTANGATGRTVVVPWPATSR